MSIKKTALAQDKQFISKMAEHAGVIRIPPEGWLRTVRRVLGLSTVQLANKVGITRALVGRNERAEMDGAITIKTMRVMAKAMNCRFVYAIVPEQEIDSMLYDQAKRKATKLVMRASDHMALEDQKLSDEMLVEEIERVTQELLRGKASNIWEDDV